MWMNKKQNLKASYYNSFFALIVIPILLIILLSILIIRTIVVDSAVSNIRRAQDNIASALGGGKEMCPSVYPISYTSMTMKS